MRARSLFVLASAAVTSWLTAPAAAAAASDPTVAKFSSLARAGNGVVKLNDQLFDELVGEPRNFSVSIVMTALGAQFKCVPCGCVKSLRGVTAGAHDRCRLFDPEYRTLARQWMRQPAAVRDGHFFAVLDFMDGRSIFQRVRSTCQRLDANRG